MKFLAKIFLLFVLCAVSLEATALYDLLDDTEFLKKEVETEKEELEDEELKEKEENRKKNHSDYDFDGFTILSNRPQVTIAKKNSQANLVLEFSHPKLFILYSQLKLCS